MSRRWSGRSWSRAAWAGLFVLALVSALASLGRTHWLLGNLSHFRPQYTMVALLLLPGFLCLPRWRPGFAVSTAILFGFNASFLTPYLVPAKEKPLDHGAAVSVLLWNTWRRNREFEGVLRVVRRADADIVLLQETSAPVRDRLEVLEDDYRILTAGSDAALVKRALPHRARVLHRDALRGLHVDMRLGSRSVGVVAVHLSAPTSNRSAERRARELAALTAWIREQAVPVVIVGDLNAAPWGHELRDLRHRCRLEDSLTGRGLQPSWPFHNALTSLLGIPVDHCLYTAGVASFDRRVGAPGRSNHRPVFVRLAPSD